MKVLFIGDGRGRLNWGANATSTAMHSLLEDTQTVSSTIPNAELGFKAPYFPQQWLAGIFKSVAIRKNKLSFIWSWFLKQGALIDYMDQDVAVSVNRFMKLKSQYPNLRLMYKKIQECDAVVLNGEGSFIFKTPPRRESLAYMMIITIAKSLGKKAYVLNAMISDCPTTGRNQETVKQMVKVFKTCDGISVRDHVSFKLLKELAPDLNFKFTPDALFSWFPDFKNGIHVKSDLTSTGLKEPFDFTAPYICVSGGSRARFDQEKATERYVALVNKLKELNLPILLVPTCRYDVFLEAVGKQTGVPLLPLDVNIYTGATILTLAKAFVSGRFHPSIMASQGGTPCVLMGSNSHKTLSLQEVLEYEDPIEYDALPDDKEVDAIFNRTKSVLEQGDTLRNKILNTVTRLAKEARTVVDVIK